MSIPMTKSQSGNEKTGNKQGRRVKGLRKI